MTITFYIYRRHLLDTQLKRWVQKSKEKQTMNKQRKFSFIGNLNYNSKCGVAYKGMNKFVKKNACWNRKVKTYASSNIRIVLGIYNQTGRNYIEDGPDDAVNKFDFRPW